MLPIEPVIFRGTDQRVAMVIRRCLSLITDQHSVTSRRHAISTLLKLEVDAEVARVLTSYRGRWDRGLLQGFLPSRAWLQSPVGDKPIQGGTTLSTAIGRAEQWRSRIRQAVHSAQRHGEDPTNKACDRFCSTLDSVMSLIDTISTRRPVHTGGPNGRICLAPPGKHEDYCELCWRRTEIAMKGDLRDADNRKLSVSRRFCEEHNPQSATSNYRRDIKFRSAFLAEIEQIGRLKLALCDSKFKFVSDLETPSGWELHIAPVTAHPEDVRRAAYALVHSRLRGTPAQCWAFKKQGLNSQQTAARLGITDRAVRLALSTIVPKLKQAEEIRWGAAPRSRFESFVARQSIRE
ncbi:hypothetical protein WIT60_07200 [Aquabacterium sp. G14]|uniref:hypothetical protein n=1 Tax=Aquabacterium sp. G14 TaxID=3130164 RepID=UPI0030B69CD2